jgi:hypothetical protein
MFPHFLRSQYDLEGNSSKEDPPVYQKKKKKFKSQTRIQSNIVRELQEAIRQSSQLQKEAQSKLAGPNENMSPERQNWGQWMVSILSSIDDRLWNRFVLKTTTDPTQNNMSCMFYLFSVIIIIYTQDIQVFRLCLYTRKIVNAINRSWHN